MKFYMVPTQSFMKSLAPRRRRRFTGRFHSFGSASQEPAFCRLRL